jgi:restriction system protein
MLKEIGSVFRTLNRIDRALRTSARGHQKRVDAVTTQPTATGRTHLSSIDLQGELWMPDIKWADTLSGVEFERWIAIIFQQEGFHVKTTPGSSDYGADLILEHGESRIVVQTKRYKSKVGVDAVQEVVAAMDYYDAEGAIVITNSTVSRQARALASRQRRTVKIWDRSMLLQLLEHRAKNDSAHQKQTSSNKSGKEENGKRDFGALCKAINENPGNSAV